MASFEKQVAPNDPCPCGSGKKYKRCCGTVEALALQRRRQQVKRTGRWALVIVGTFLLLLIGVILVEARRETVTPPAYLPPAPQRAAEQPEQPASPGLTPQPGPAPEGKVWSPEHGHWHDAPAAPAAPGITRPVRPGAEPPGPAPEGKVWSPEHGHWHDAPVPAAPAAPVREVTPEDAAE